MAEFSQSFLPFCNHEFLADCKVKTEEKVYPAHKIVLCAYSKYFFTLFQASSANEVALPKLVQPKIQIVLLGDVFPEVLKFMYSGQNPDSIVGSLNLSNVFMFLSLAVALEIQPLLDMAEQFIIIDVLTMESAVDVLEESLAQKSKTLVDASTGEIIKNFEVLCKTQEKKLTGLPYEAILSVLSSSKLSTTSESIVFNFVCSYIVTLDEKDPHRLELLSKVRWAFLSHTELMQASSNPLLVQSKDLILEGLSAQLSIHEESDYKYKIDTEPRQSYSTFSPQKALSSKDFFQSSSKSFKQVLGQTAFDKKKLEIKFKYSHDFDENGIFFYLGSAGKTCKWQNPHLIGEVRAFGSSIGSGKIEEFVGRNCNSLRTGHEEGGFLGVDLGQGRLFSPSAYTIKNSKNVAYATLNWHFEGSLDRVRWVVLDRRVHFLGNSDYDSQMEAERNALMKRAASSTWAIAGNKKNHFRYFRVIGTQQNLAGSYCLALSCIEMYGTVVSGTWP